MRDRTRSGRSWLIGLLVGAVAGFAIVEGGVLGLLVLLLLGIWAAAGPHPALAIGGLFVGIGAGISALTLRAQAACDPASCVGPDLTLWYAFFGGLIVVGLALTVVGIRRAGATEGSGSTKARL